jgi:hypothetical protein
MLVINSKKGKIELVVAVAAIVGMMDWIAWAVRVEITELLWRLRMRLRNLLKMSTVSIAFRRMTAYRRRMHKSRRREVVDRSLARMHGWIGMHRWKTALFR